mgnify:CR=1 FL=1
MYSKLQTINPKPQTPNCDQVEDYARLSYEIGMEEAEYDIQAPWIRKSIEVKATEEMKGYNIGKLVVVECDLLDEKNGREKSQALNPKP